MKILVIGADAAGMSAASQIRRRQPSWSVEVFESGERSSYGLCGTPYFIGGEVKNIEQLVSITPEKFQTERGIKIHLKHEVTAVHPAKKSIVAKNILTGELREVNYDRLMIATGAQAIEPKGFEPGPENLFYLRSLDDAVHIRKKALTSKTAIVVGAGYIGLEVTEALVHAGLHVTLLGREPAPIFETELRNMAAIALARPEVDFRRGIDATGLKEMDDGRLEISVSSGGSIIADMVVVGAGVRPRSKIAEDAGLDLGERKAIKVDRHQRCSNPFIYAGGDCAESYHLVTKSGTYIALALGANRQGKSAGLNISGIAEKTPGVLGTSVMKLFDLALACTGLSLEAAQKAGYTSAVKTVIEQASKPKYYPGSSPVTCAVIHDQTSGRLLGAQLAGTVDGVGQRINSLATAISANMTVKEMASVDTAYAPPFAPVYDPIIIACELAAKKNI